jgi:hypothetical protein
MMMAGQPMIGTAAAWSARRARTASHRADGRPSPRRQNPPVRRGRAGKQIASLGIGLTFGSAVAPGHATGSAARSNPAAKCVDPARDEAPRDLYGDVVFNPVIIVRQARIVRLLPPWLPRGSRDQIDNPAIHGQGVGPVRVRLLAARNTTPGRCWIAQSAPPRSCHAP